MLDIYIFIYISGALCLMPDCLFTLAISDSIMHNAVLDMYLNMLFNIFGVLIIRFRFLFLFLFFYI